MRRAGLSRIPRRDHVALIFVGVLCLVLMPLDYRAGASISHPHSILQLLYDLSHGSLLHHADATASGDVQPNEAHDHAAPLRPDQLDLELSDAGAAWTPAGLSPATTIAALTKLATDTGSVGNGGDEPEPAPRSAPGTYVAYSLALPVAPMLAWHWSWRRQPWPLAPAWQGLTLAPEPPPPQVAAVAHRLLIGVG